jgi:hypothetical protein
MIKTRTIKKACPTVNPTRASVTEFRNGPDPRGPARCLRCSKLFKKGETWRRTTSPVDPELGAYSIGIHDQCSQSG